MAIESERAGLSFEREKDHTIYYDGIEVGTRRADFVVEDKVIVELKAVINLEDVYSHNQQVMWWLTTSLLGY